MDFWRVNSYAYPNPFNPDRPSQEAWATCRSFYDYDGRSYKALKNYWGSDRAPRRLNHAGLESWKAAFEEFGLLYVISRSDIVKITPAGKQLFLAVERNSQRDFVWTGLNLLFRYPLQGPPRGRQKSAEHQRADILPYRFLYSAMRDLGDYFWWSELEKVLCRVFSTSAAGPAVQAIKALRADPSSIKNYPLPTEQRKGAFYNSLNQVANHAGMNHVVLIQDDRSGHYGANESRRRHLISRDYLPLVSRALGDSNHSEGCASSAYYVDRLPKAPSFVEEQAYFDYLGATVTDFDSSHTATEPSVISLAGDTVFVLRDGEHFRPIEIAEREFSIEGSTAVFCRIARNHRVILSTDMHWTYLVCDKSLTGPGTVKLSLRRGRPITSAEPLEALLGK